MSDGVAAPNANLTLISSSVCATVLLLSAIGHLRSGAMRYELAAHGIVPVRLHRFVSSSVPRAEGLLALVIVGSLMLTDSLLRLGLAASAVLFGCYGAYSLAVAYRAPEIRSDCGCGVGEHPIGVTTAARAAAFAVLAATGTLGNAPPLRTDGLLISVLMSVSAVCLLVWLPVSLSRPGRPAEEHSR